MLRGLCYHIVDMDTLLQVVLEGEAKNVTPLLSLVSRLLDFFSFYQEKMQLLT